MLTGDDHSGGREVERFYCVAESPAKITRTGVGKNDIYLMSSLPLIMMTARPSHMREAQGSVPLIAEFEVGR
ncbi:unnamed protein product [Allacma fusca]|uniref:Uncharacterized protein n=1 Tax=Allacma fusca TaxID=39272 RepID=A0A8J2K7M7_9HEXA|nr:unnamed protein product [Allacma fusca]